ncbi:hypothetical protein QOT17_010341 [Balamuthia mandrillaris]
MKPRRPDDAFYTFYSTDALQKILNCYTIQAQAQTPFFFITTTTPTHSITTTRHLVLEYSDIQEKGK